MQTARTERTVITALSETDIAALQAYSMRNVEHLRAWEPLRPEGYHEYSAWAERVEQQLQEVEAGRAFRFVARLKGEADILAVVNFSNVVRGAFLACHLGYSIDGQRQGKGLMFEILSALIPRIFDDDGLHRIMANYIPENRRSGELLKRLGFEVEGVARDYLQIAGRWQDHVLTSKIAPSKA